MSYNVAKDFVESITTMEGMLIKAYEDLQALAEKRRSALGEEYLKLDNKMNAYSKYISKLTGLLIRTSIVTYSNYANIDQINEASLQNKGMLKGVEPQEGFDGLWSPLYAYELTKGNVLTTCRNLYWEASHDDSVEWLKRLYTQTLESGEKGKVLPPKSIMGKGIFSFNSDDFELPAFPSDMAIFDEDIYYAPEGEELENEESKNEQKLPDWLENIKGDFDDESNK